MNDDAGVAQLVRARRNVQPVESRGVCMIKIEDVIDPRDGSIFIRRYMLWFTKRACINVMYKDYEHFHCHPWNYLTIIVWGGYKETVFEGDREVEYIRKPGYISRRSFDQFHKVEPVKRKAITLFFRSKPLAKFSKFKVDGQILTGAKYWLKQGVDVRPMFLKYKD